MDKLVEAFLFKALGGRDIDKINNLDDFVTICVHKAYVDMLTGGRYVNAKLSKRQLAEIQKVFKNHNYIFCRDMIDEVSNIISAKEIIQGSSGRYATRYGLAQKIVNMTYKYFYVFNELHHFSELDEIYSNCDCPLDSVILKELNHSGTVWTKVSKKEYINIQDIIADKVEPNSLGNLLYDFMHW